MKVLGTELSYACGRGPRSLPGVSARRERYVLHCGLARRPRRARSRRASARLRIENLFPRVRVRSRATESAIAGLETE